MKHTHGYHQHFKIDSFRKQINPWKEKSQMIFQNTLRNFQKKKSIPEKFFF